jgi:magnesium chelatase family protein
MITRLFSATLRGIDAQEVEVEVNARGADKPIVIIVGLPDAAVRESSQRVTSAIGASALYLDDGVKTVNLAPADLKKEGPSFDLPIALAMVAASRTKPFNADDCCVVGELGLDGAVRPVKGLLSIALEAKRRGRTRLLVPEANAPEAAVIEGIDVFPIRNLKQAWDFLEEEIVIPPFHLDRRAFFNSHRTYEVDFDEVKGQHFVKRALEVAAAGGHNLLMLCCDYQDVGRHCIRRGITSSFRSLWRFAGPAQGDRKFLGLFRLGVLHGSAGSMASLRLRRCV